MANHSYIENADEAHCSFCTFRCEPVCDDGSFDFEYGGIKGTHSFGEEWTSDCCSSAIIDENDNPWEAEVCEGSPEE